MKAPHSTSGSRKAISARQWFVSDTAKEGDLSLINFLQSCLPDKSRTTVKQLLRDRFVSVDGIAETVANRSLQKGQKVELHKYPIPDEIHHPLLEILYQDEDLLVCAKKPGISTVASGMDRQHTAMRILSTHLKTYNTKIKLFMLNRLDKDTGGIVLFAKSRDAQEYITRQWTEIVEEQVYHAVIEGRPEEDRGILLKPVADKQNKDHKEDPASLIFSSENRIFNSDASSSAGVASYKVIRHGAYCSLLEISLKHGRNNQIRRQMRQAGLPLAGDRHGGSIFPELGCVALQCTRLVMRHPINWQRMTFKQAIPALFRRLMQTSASTSETKTPLDSKSQEKKRYK